MRSRFTSVTTLLAPAAFALAACTRFGAVYPPRPPETTGAPIADPSPSRVTAHVAIGAAALREALDAGVPRTGDGTFTALRSERKYHWERAPFEVSFGQGRVGLDTKITTKVELPLTALELPMDVHVLAEPVLSAEYKFRLQAVDVKVVSSDRRLKIADAATGILETVSDQIKAKLKDFAYDVRPTVEEAFARIAKPIELPLGDAKGCASMKVLGIEAGPTILADGIEKDLALVVAPQVTLPCGEAPTEPAPLPPLANVATIVPGPFNVTVPIAARYDELAKAMQLTFTNGKFFFSKTYPELYLETPELYASSQGELVLKLRIRGPVHAMGIDTDLDGDLFLSGHPVVVDNEVRLPDLEPTIETKNFLLRLKALADGDTIRDQARGALRIDVGERLVAVRLRLSRDLSFAKAGGCFRGDVDKIEITGVFAHASYLRVHVGVTARAALTAPCSAPPVAPPG